MTIAKIDKDETLQPTQKGCFMDENWANEYVRNTAVLFILSF